MSLQYIIDGYNLTNHSAFASCPNKKTYDRKIALLELIRAKKLTGSQRNAVTVVFDGYPELEEQRALNDFDNTIKVIFSRNQSADERIRKITQASGNPKNTVVVSDDREIKFSVRSLGAKAMSVEEFIGHKDKIKPGQAEAPESEITYTQMHKINQEFKKIWLK